VAGRFKQNNWLGFVGETTAFPNRRTAVWTFGGRREANRLGRPMEAFSFLGPRPEFRPAGRRATFPYPAGPGAPRGLAFRTTTRLGATGLVLVVTPLPWAARGIPSALGAVTFSTDLVPANPGTFRAFLIPAAGAGRGPGPAAGPETEKTGVRSSATWGTGRASRLSCF